MEKKTVIVLFGGVSSEHEVSRRSVTSVLNSIDRTKYDVIPVGITKAGVWYRYDGPTEAIMDGGWETKAKVPAVISPDRSHHGLLVLEDGGWRVMKADIVFPVLHGKNGEDGTMQGLFELAGLPYCGSGVMSSANCMDKETSKIMMRQQGIPVAEWIAVHHEQYDLDTVAKQCAEKLRFPVFVKPANAGSSVGINKAHDKAELQKALDEAFLHDKKVLIEETLVGAEVECAVMGNFFPIASDIVGQIVPKRELYDYEGKYLDGSTDLYLPAHIPAEQAERVRALAVRGYRVMSCEGFARVDFFALPDGRIILNEINSLPGFTSISMYPKLFEASGINFTQMINHIIEYGLERADG